ncbi:MAG: N-acetylmuramoyl-L-alanine amidase, partial [Streptomyces sp.]|uniref:N-acetylmuramoyl-L-alanine amidase n=1 Tax=Streptomyces sp. TaxID=1931 RepID=UPI003D6BC814
MNNRRRVWTTAFGGVLAATVAVVAQTANAAPAPAPAGSTMGQAFTKAASEFDVPRDLLVAVGYSETHLDGHDGKPSQDNGFGVMHLVSNPERHTLERAAKLTGESKADLRKDDAANIRGAAAVLRADADKAGLKASDRADLAAWYPTVARYGGAESDQLARLYADSAFEFVSKGVRGRTAGAEDVRSAPHKVSPDRGEFAKVSADPGTRSDDYPPAIWNPADAANYATGRTAAISQVVVHVTQGSYAGTISWFKNPDSQVSAHYVIRSSDGEVTQMVRDGDTAWHAKGGNASAIGIEHEGFVDDPSWFTDAMYRSSAALTKYMCDKYGIPKDRAHVVGHSEVPGNDHTDPGPNWNWDTYM